MSALAFPSGGSATEETFRVLHHPASRRMRLLLAEDDEQLAQACLEYFARHGIDAVWSGDGRDCLETMRRQDFDVVLLDLGLPGTDGLRVMHVARVDPAISDTPIVVLTGADPDYAERALRRGAVRVLHKPTRMHAVMRMLREVVAQRSLPA